jgi:competence protein ComEC
MKLDKPPVYNTIRSFWIFIAILSIIISIRIYAIYDSYRDFISKPFIITNATVIYSESREKNGYNYTLLKLKTDDNMEFYTVTNDETALQSKKIRIKLSPSADITFWRYLGTPFIQSSISEIAGTVPKTSKDSVIEFIHAQHQNPQLKSLFASLYLATPLDKEIRQPVTALGIAHIVALSGFNLSILWGVIYGLLWLIYRPFQQRYFPYRYAFMDLGFIALLGLGYYVWFVDFSPSLIRAYLMVLAGWGIMLLGMELVSFYFLATISMIMLALFPRLLVSLSFWFSVAGVFYIFLVLHYTKSIGKNIIKWLAIPFGVFLFMQPIVHTFFGGVSWWQFVSIPLEVIYVVFYPLMIPLHMLGYGGVSDTLLLKLFALPPKEIAQSILPWWGLALFVIMSLASIISKKAFIALCVATLGYCIYIFMFV